MPTDPHDFLPLGDLAFLILLALGDGPAHGYAVGKEVSARSAGRLDPTTGALYQALRRLAEGGLLAPAASPAGEVDARRKYFRITPLGRRVATAEAERLDAMVAAARAKHLFPAQ
jgi:DNA-binding PadR family transcriptional regulator